MKKRLTYILVFSFLYLTVWGQVNGLTVAQKSIAKGDLKKLTSIFYKNIDLTFSNQVKTYSKAQAGIIIKKFFSKHEPKSFKIMHKGKSNANNTLYAIGTMTTSNGSYRVYMFFIPSKNDYMLRELRFEKN